MERLGHIYVYIDKPGPVYRARNSPHTLRNKNKNDLLVFRNNIRKHG